ncbi:unnamed protein product [Vitrella brassicaformis CCMP3155]|uniref:Uncharacterized protein n=1 Tax=Vitrella brassicaformis (strain CCMP3155) TaxID=1169540 RepID=A0A0G4EPL8_VITBC|nr:unnamed protein product [Vitrella brassicaformis CCMP3155]|eukprot:CEL99205.1 unnamed protein product [Vitrella brassicaformis CCMP3155]
MRRLQSTAGAASTTRRLEGRRSFDVPSGPAPLMPYDFIADPHLGPFWQSSILLKNLDGLGFIDAQYGPARQW